MSGYVLGGFGITLVVLAGYGCWVTLRATALRELLSNSQSAVSTPSGNGSSS